MCIKTFKKSIILASFAKAGLIPYNPEKVLAPFREKQEKRSTPEPSISSISSPTTEDTWPTPHNLPELREYAHDLYQTSLINDASPTSQRRLNRFMDASFGMIIAGVEAEETLREHKKEAQERAKRQEG